MSNFANVARRVGAILLAGVVLSGCKVGLEAHGIKPYRSLSPPSEMFPNTQASKKSYARHVVMYYFKAGRDQLKEDPALALEVMAYFEYLAHDIKRYPQVPLHKIQKVLDARNEFREMTGVPLDAEPEEAMAMLLSLSKFVRKGWAPPAPGVDEPAEIAERRKLVGRVHLRTQAVLRKAMKEVRRANAATAANVAGGGPE